MYTDARKQNQSYHHGNVKEALIDVAMQMIEANRPGLLSLRRLAKEVGVTPSAVYNHFSDKSALMLAIKIRLYEEINQYFEERVDAAADPEAALLASCLAYYHFSQQYPAHFHILFSSTLPMDWSTPQTVETSCRSIVRTRKLVFEIYQKYQIPCSEEEVVNTTLLIWSQLHGIVALKRSGSIKAAVAYQDWPASCALAQDKDVERLIGNHVAMTINAISGGQRGENQH